MIGRDGHLPWTIPEDTRFFHAMTAGHVVVLGRVCFDSWPQAVKDGRRPVVVTAHPETLPGSPASGTVSFPAALEIADSLPGEIFICGGERIYAESLETARPLRLYLTQVHAEVPGDRFFPDWRRWQWRELDRRESSDPNYRYTFLTLDRVTEN